MLDLCLGRFIVAISTVFARGEVYAPLVDVELFVRGPDAKPLVTTPIEVMAADNHDDNKPQPPKISAKTDVKGIAHFKFPGGNYGDLHIESAGIGYGDLGITRLEWGETANLTVPPLAPYCTIEGTVPPEAPQARHHRDGFSLAL